jgi:hypothetical protein
MKVQRRISLKENVSASAELVNLAPIHILTRDVNQWSAALVIH